MVRVKVFEMPMYMRRILILDVDDRMEGVSADVTVVGINVSKTCDLNRRKFCTPGHNEYDTGR